MLHTEFFKGFYAPIFNSLAALLNAQTIFKNSSTNPTQFDLTQRFHRLEEAMNEYDDLKAMIEGMNDQGLYADFARESEGFYVL